MTEPNADQIVVAGDGKVSVAPKGTALPTDIDGALNVAFLPLGYIDENGATFTDGRTMQDVMAWQSFYPVRRVVQSKDATVSFNLREWNRATVPLAFGGGAITTTTNGFKYTPPAPEEVDDRAMVIDWQDDTKNYRLVIPNGMVTDNVATQLVRANAADLPITFGATPQTGDDAWYLLTDDPSFSAT